MGFFSKLLGVTGQKVTLIRRLLRERIRQDPTAAVYGQGPQLAVEMPALMMMGTPEATIVTCVETCANLSRAGQNELTTANRIASFRGGSAGSGSVSLGVSARIR